MASPTGKEINGEQGISAADHDADGMSFGLHALGELHAEQHGTPSQAPVALDAVPASAMNSAPDITGAASDAADAAGAVKANLQAALDWYKDWLSSM